MCRFRMSYMILSLHIAYRQVFRSVCWVWMLRSLRSWTRNLWSRWYPRSRLCVLLRSFLEWSLLQGSLKDGNVQVCSLEPTQAEHRTWQPSLQVLIVQERHWQRRMRRIMWYPHLWWLQCSQRRHSSRHLKNGTSCGRIHSNRKNWMTARQSRWWLIRSGRSRILHGFWLSVLE